MNMVRLIHMSHFNGSANPNDIQDILAISRKNKPWPTPVRTEF
ncbi:MAG: BLUF domain-containing protein [Planctomycetes bacterium]|nr:BLUF domain-containing protein [Planctomycetota bacterium]